MSESIHQLIANQPAGRPTEILMALAILDSDICGSVRGKSHDVVETFLTHHIQIRQEPKEQKA